MTRTEAVEARLRQAMTEARGRGFRILRNEWLWAQGRTCCAIGALDLAFDDRGGNADDWEEHAAGLLEITPGKVAAIASGFDGRNRDALGELREWRELGARLWEFAKSQGWTEPVEVVQ